MSADKLERLAFLSCSSSLPIVHDRVRLGSQRTSIARPGKASSDSDTAAMVGSVVTERRKSRGKGTMTPPHGFLGARRPVKLNHIARFKGEMVSRSFFVNQKNGIHPVADSRLPIPCSLFPRDPVKNHGATLGRACRADRANGASAVISHEKAMMKSRLFRGLGCGSSRLHWSNVRRCIWTNSVGCP